VEQAETVTHLEVIEGTWEELAAYAEVLKGRRLRLIVLPVAAETTDSVTNEPRLRETAARLFAEADCIEREPGTPRSHPYRAAFGEIIAEKHRRWG
jgi:hypothetical protein